MNPHFAIDFDFLTRDLGRKIVWGAYSATAVVKVATDDDVAEDGFLIVRGETPVATYRAADLPGLKRPMIVTLDGIDHKVRRVDLAEDGLMARAYMEPV